MSTKKKIFLGFTDIAGQLFEFAESYEKKGYKVYTAVNTENVNYPHRKYSIVLSRIYPSIFKNDRFVIIRKFFTLTVYKPYFFIFMLVSIMKYDIFHFMWYIDRSNAFYLKLIRLFNKKVIVTFVGGDIRWVPLWLAELEMRKMDHVDDITANQNTIKQKYTLNTFLRTVRVFEKYSSLIISHPEYTQLLLRPYMNFYLPLNINSFPARKSTNTRPIVSIGLRNDDTKGGTPTIKLIQDYKQNGNSVEFDLVFLENLDNKVVMEWMSKTDIFIYSPYMASAGKFGHEAVACGAVALVSYNSDWFTLPPEPPFVAVTEATLISKLDHYLRNHKEREEISVKGMAWAKKWTDIDWITDDILDKLENNKDPDYYPNYFREYATFDTKWDAHDSVAIANKWTKYVSKTEWYKRHIKPGKREGLEF